MFSKIILCDNNSFFLNTSKCLLLYINIVKQGEGIKSTFFSLFFSELSVICNDKHNIHNFKFDKICIA